MFENFLDSLTNVSKKIDEKIDKLLPDLEKDNKIIAAMRYSTLSSGKRLRPFLTIISAGIFNVNSESALKVAAAIEMIHSYSLIHDDLPALDNDDYRRNQLSCHKKFDEATAILAGNALLTLAFEIIADNSVSNDANIRCELISQLAKSIGFNGMIGGQSLDIEYKNSNININDVVRIQRMKTGALFSIATEAGAILGKAPKNLYIALKGYAHAIGLAFQITDDIIDSNNEIKEIEKNEASFVKIMGIKKSKEQANILIEQAISHLSLFDYRADLLRDLAKYIITR